MLRLRSLAARPVLALYAAALRRSRAAWRFRFDGTEHAYFYHRYNRTWLCERVVEIPLALDGLRRAGPGRVLEVGNVLAHYGVRGHDVLDKYEEAAGLIREDAADFRPARPYDLILTLSTIEHIGWDEVPQEPRKVLAAVENLRRCLAPGGRMMATWPVGYHPELDRAVDAGELAPARLLCLRRTSARNEWAEATWAEIRGLRFGSPYPFANGLCVGEFAPL